jgi:hypothetical protein
MITILSSDQSELGSKDIRIIRRCIHTTIIGNLVVIVDIWDIL